MNRMWRIWATSVLAVVLGLIFAGKVGAEAEENLASATAEQRIVQIATAELPPKNNETGNRYILASMPGDTVAVLFLDRHMYAMRKNGTLEQVEGSGGSWAIASEAGTAFAVFRGVKPPEDYHFRDHFRDPYVSVKAQTFDSELRPVAAIDFGRYEKTILSNDGRFIVGVSPQRQSTPGGGLVCFHHPGKPRLWTNPYSVTTHTARLSSDGQLLIGWGYVQGRLSMLAFDSSGNALWQVQYDKENVPGRSAILSAAGRIIATWQSRIPTFQSVMAFQEHGTPDLDTKRRLVVLSLDGTVIYEPLRDAWLGGLFASPMGDVLISWSRNRPIRRLNPDNTEVLWSIEPAELGEIDEIRVTGEVIYGYDIETATVIAVDLDGAVMGRWTCPGKGDGWDPVSSASSPQRFVTARGQNVFVCEFVRDQP